MSRRSEILQRLVAEYAGKSELIRLERVLQREPNTAVRVMCNIPEYPHMEGVGFSSVSHLVVFNAERGIRIAVNKALGHIARELAQWEAEQEERAPQ